jgi:pteridine reductase
MNKVALVTGAGVRLGKAIALRLGAEGYDLALHYRGSRQEAEDTAGGVPRGELFQADLGRPDGAAGLASAVLERMGQVDLLVNSAAIFFPTPTLAQAEESWDELMSLNVRAPLSLARHLEGTLRAQRGSIVNIVDIYALRPAERFLSYSVSKGALWSLTQSLAMHFAPDVRVNAVSPGAALPPVGATPEEEERLTGKVPLQRMGGADSIAQAVSYLAAADFVTGQMICVDGGRTLRM